MFLVKVLFIMQQIVKVYHKYLHVQKDIHITQDPVTGQMCEQLLYTEEPIILATEQFNYGAGIAIGTHPIRIW